jgi:hypothetical protein
MVSLQKSFGAEFFFPANERWSSPVKDKIVSLLPDFFLESARELFASRFAKLL